MKNKIVIGLLLGGLLGLADGLSSGFYPEVAAVPNKVLIIGCLSSLKGLVGGLITGAVARKLQNLPLGIVAGFLAFALVTLPAAMGEDPDTHTVHFWEIMIPGAICGMIVGFATQRYGRVPATALPATNGGGIR